MAEEDLFCDNCEDLSYSDLDQFPEFLSERSSELQGLQLNHNNITILPRCIGSFSNLVTLDISNNHMTYLSKEIARLGKLISLSAKNNLFENEAIPKEIAMMTSLEHVNFSGNHLTDFPMEFTHLVNLRKVYLGGNSMETLPEEIVNLQRLEVLYLGGNSLRHIPAEVGYLVNLASLILCDNKLEALPSTLAGLRKLQSLSLHNNRLSTLPQEIVTLELEELSLRSNPLVVRFVQDMVYKPPSLLELAGRCIKAKNVAYSPQEVPRHLVDYLESAHRCVNPKCKGVYFSTRFEHVKFVDFCGKYRLPLLQYLCSPSCSTSPAVCFTSDSESEDDVPTNRMQKVLLPFEENF